jgi:hypothetical protein
VTRIDAMVMANVPARLRFNMVGPPLGDGLIRLVFSVQLLQRCSSLLDGCC